MADLNELSAQEIGRRLGLESVERTHDSAKMHGGVSTFHPPVRCGETGHLSGWLVVGINLDGDPRHKCHDVHLWGT